jgi:GDP-4-dehydro-6-deoxy-D-mannose reductase
LAGKSLNILITGITGFVGGYLARALARGEEGGGPEAPNVVGTSFPQAPPASSGNIFYLDLRVEGDVRDLVRRVRPEWVFHLAAVSNVRSSWQARRDTLETNVLGTHNLLEAVRLEAPRARVLFVSSSDVYGVAAEGDAPLAEDRSFRVTNPYAYSKAAGEMMCGFYERIEGLDIVIARPFPHTGPGQAPDFVCADWARQVVRIERGESEPVLRVGNLDVRRDFSDVRDVVEAYVALMRKGRRGEVYNVCSGKALALREILDFLVGEAGAGAAAGTQATSPGTRVAGAAQTPAIRIEVDPAKLRKTDVPLLIGDNRKIVAETGWSPRIPIAQTLRDLLSGVRSQLLTFLSKVET